MEDTRSRLYVIENLWQKTSGCLVLIEHGSKAGYTALMEARNFLLQINRQIRMEPEPLRPQSDETEIVDRLSSTSGSIMAPVCVILLSLILSHLINITLSII